MRTRVTAKKIENYEFEIDYDTESSKVWIVIHYKSRKTLNQIEKEFSGKGAIKQAQDYLELFLGILKDKQELENRVTPNKIVQQTMENIHNIKSIMAVTVDSKELKVHVVMQDENDEIVHLALLNNPGETLSHRLQQKLLELSTEIYIYRENRRDRNDSTSNTLASEIN